MFKALGFIFGIAAGIASILFAFWKMWIIGAFIAFFLITVGKN